MRYKYNKIRWRKTFVIMVVSLCLAGCSEKENEVGTEMSQNELNNIEEITVAPRLEESDRLDDYETQSSHSDSLTINYSEDNMIMAVTGGEKDVEKSNFGYDTRLSVIKGEDGWLHFFSCEYVKGEKTPTSYVYNAYNLKYKYLEDYKLKVYDENGDIIGETSSSLPYLILNEKYWDDFMHFIEYFDKNKPESPLSIEETFDLEISVLDKEMIIDLFNCAIGADMLGEGKYYYLPEADIVLEDKQDGYSWQVAFFIVRGVIVDVNIELIYDNGSYLSDLVSRNEGDTEKNNVYDAVSNIEMEILNGQSFVVDSEAYEVLNTIDSDRLKLLLQSVEKGSYN